MNKESSKQDNLLIDAICTRNESASFDKLFHKYYPMVNKVINRYNFRLLETEDLIQEARIVCYRTALAYDVSNNVSFGRFFQQSLLNCFCSLLRRETAKKRRGDIYAESYNQLLETQGESAHETDLLVSSTLAVILAKETILSMAEDMNEFEYSIFNLLVFEQYTPERISSDLHLPIIKVNRSIAQSRNKLSSRFDEP
ncbi:sigma-70 family RNA polymerase sigma factor [Liquorilactobacillus aquaticus]|nr:sigma-70 family RNA polymerase sigma factor [Liquorilactobacillus aquaticus]